VGVPVAMNRFSALRSALAERRKLHAIINKSNKAWQIETRGETLLNVIELPLKKPNNKLRYGFSFIISSEHVCSRIAQINIY
jgi:hypothetical protein